MSLNDQDLSSQLDCHVGAPIPLNEVVYCDDTAIPVVDDTSKVVSKSLKIIESLVIVFGAFGLALSFSNGKTECVPFFECSLF